MRCTCLLLMFSVSLAGNLHDCADHGLPASYLPCPNEGVPLCCDGRYEASLETMCQHPNLFPCRRVLDSSSISSPYSDVPLTSWPMLMTHDAATGYMQGSLDPRVVWGQTQPSSTQAFTSQLDCGARAFDMRPHVTKKGDLVFHHGDVEVSQDAEKSIAEIVQWAHLHPSLEDFVLIYNWDCTGMNCSDRFEGLLGKYNLRTLTDCSKLNQTLSTAASMAKLPQGGHVLVVSGCVSQKCNASLACSGFDKSLDAVPFTHTLPADCRALENASFDEQLRCGHALQQSNNPAALAFGYYHCWVGDSGHDFAVQRLMDYLVQVASSPPPGDSFTELQALWQETPQSVASHGELQFISFF